MAYSSKFPSAMNKKTQRLLTLLCAMFGITVDLRNSLGFKATLECREGGKVQFTVVPQDIGLSVSTAAPTTPVIPLTPATGTLTAGVNASVSLTNASGDTLAVRRTGTSGVDGDLRVVRVDNSTVSVTSYRADGTTTETGDAGTFEVFCLGQA